jgi:class 3 adenylate cyclase/tetratricopeptide (TPR) repeat protein
MSPVRSFDERKLVTVLFADLASSTELAIRHDPEQVRALLAAFFEEMTQQIIALGGTVEKYAGDAIMAVFGVPRVHEDDAERSVRAAVAMRESLAQLNPMFEQDYGVQLELRVGIASGEAVAAARPAREFMVTGEVANLAARLQSASGGIVISEETHRLVGPLLEVERLEPLTLKGFAEAVTAYRVDGLRPLEAGARGIPGLSSPVVGRETETESLRRSIEELASGRGQVVSITGEAGLGKSRLKIERRERLPEGLRWIEGRCHAYTQSTSYAPLIQILRAMFQLTGGEAQPIARTKVRAAIRSLAGERHDQAQAAVAHLLGIELEPGRRSEGAADPQQLQAQIVVGLRALLEGLLARSPVVLAVEDIHWADTASIDTLTILTELTDFLPLMILVTSRPDVEGGSWSFRFHVQRNFPHRLTEIQLRPLGPEASERLANNLLHVSELPEPLRRQMMERSEGNPFFLEEIIRTLIERQVLRREGDRWIAVADGGGISLPATLRGVIAARIDRLGEVAKATIQRASVVGRFFTRRALLALAEDNADLDRALADLMRAELIREQRRLPEPEYLFKHALTQEAAYAGILLEQRRLLHRRLAGYLEQEQGSLDERAALLAHHWLLAEDWEKALKYTVLAAERARQLYARPEAIALYWQAVELLDRLPRTQERSRLHIDVVLGLVAIPGWMLDEARRQEGLRQIEAAMRTATEIGDVGLLVRLEAREGNISSDESVLRRMLARAEASGDRMTLALAHSQYGDFLGNQGRYEEALTRYGRAIDLLGGEGARYDQAMNMAVGGRCYSSRAGRIDDALSYAARAREIGEELGDARLRAWRAMEAEPYLYRGLWAEVVQVAEENLPLAFEIGEWGVMLFTSAWLGMAYVKLGRLDEAGRVLERAAREGRARVGYSYPMSFVETAVAQLHLALGEPARAVEAAREALGLAERGGFRLEQGAAHRVLGLALEALGSWNEADSAFRKSREILEAIQSSPEVAQTLLGHGRFLARDDRAAGRALVERALVMFEEMGATGWLEEARRAL